MAAAEDLSDLIGDVYDCAVDPGLWRATLVKVAHFIRGDFSILISEDAVSSNARVHYTSRDESEWLQAYFEKYIYLNPTLIPAMLNSKVGDTVCASTFFPYQEFTTTRFFKEWVKPKGFVDVVSAVVEKSTTSFAFLAVLRHERDGPADKAALRRMKLVAPHVRRAIGIGRLLDLNQLRSSALAETLDTLAAWVILVDGSGRIIHANASARLALEEATLLRDAKGRLVAVDSNTDAALCEVFHAAAHGDSTVGTDGIAVPLRSASHEPYLAHVLPLTSGVRRQAAVMYDAVAAVFVRKAGLDVPSPLAGLAELYRLTPREMSVLLAIVEVGGVPAVAAILGLTQATVKTYLKGIFQKTGAKRQADLVKLVAGLANPFAALRGQ
jgi:DNA-binding CsgD family transcriptional regulator